MSWPKNGRAIKNNLRAGDPVLAGYIRAGLYFIFCLFRAITIHLKRRVENVTNNNYAITKLKNSIEIIFKYLLIDFDIMQIERLKSSQK